MQNLLQAESHDLREFLLFIQELAEDPVVPKETAEQAQNIIPAVCRDLDEARANYIISMAPALETPVRLISKIPFGR